MLPVCLCIVHECMYVATSQQIDRFSINFVWRQIMNILYILRDILFISQQLPIWRWPEILILHATHLMRTNSSKKIKNERRAI
jgi:hypothetical protein